MDIPNPRPSGTPAPAAAASLPVGNWVLIGAALLVGLAAITTQSFWMDEASTASGATQLTLGNWWAYLSSHRGSDPQMPLYMIYIWGWVKLFGCTEWGLRAANVPWLILGFLAIPRRQAGFLLVFALSPFLWFYTDEARPYVMQLSASLILVGSLVHFLDIRAAAPPGAAQAERRWLGIFCCGLVLLAGSSMLGMIWAAAAVGAFVLLLGWPNACRLARAGWLSLVVTAAAIAALTGYYAWTIKNGDSGTPGTTGVANVIFIFYELLGLAGLGPGRNDIHGAGLMAFHSWYLLPLAGSGIVLLAVMIAGVVPVVREIPRRTWVALLIPLAGMSLLLLLAGKIRHISMLGRHFAPLGVCLLLLLGASVQRLWQLGGWRRALAVTWLLLSLASAVSFRCCERHQKDDYRTAAQIAIAAWARGERVWWCADGTGGKYYGVPLTKARSPAAVPGKIWLIADPPADWLATNQMPTFMVFSKPELHDKYGTVRGYLQRNHFVCQQSFSVFTIWTHPE